MNRLLITSDKNGKVKEGCHNCIRPRFEPHVYTARKLWTGDEVYGREKCKELDHDYGQSQIRQAQDNRRRRPIRAVQA